MQSLPSGRGSSISNDREDEDVVPPEDRVTGSDALIERFLFTDDVEAEQTSGY
jgi:hypothetical protein